MSAPNETEQLRAALRYVLPGLPVLATLLDRAGLPRGAEKARAMESAVSIALAEAHRNRPKVADIIDWVSLETGVPKSLLNSSDRSTRAVRARFASMWGARHILGLSYPRIGQVFGVHHSSVLHAARRAEEMNEHDPAFRRLLLRMVDRYGRAA